MSRKTSFISSDENSSLEFPVYSKSITMNDPNSTCTTCTWNCSNTCIVFVESCKTLTNHPNKVFNIQLISTISIYLLPKFTLYHKIDMNDTDHPLVQYMTSFDMMPDFESFYIRNDRYLCLEQTMYMPTQISDYGEKERLHQLIIVFDLKTLQPYGHIEETTFNSLRFWKDSFPVEVNDAQEMIFFLPDISSLFQYSNLCKNPVNRENIWYVYQWDNRHYYIYQGERSMINWHLQTGNMIGSFDYHGKQHKVCLKINNYVWAVCHDKEYLYALCSRYSKAGMESDDNQEELRVDMVGLSKTWYILILDKQSLEIKGSCPIDVSMTSFGTIGRGLSYKMREMGRDLVICGQPLDTHRDPSEVVIFRQRLRSAYDGLVHCDQPTHVFKTNQSSLAGHFIMLTNRGLVISTKFTMIFIKLAHLATGFHSLQHINGNIHFLFE